MYNLYRLINKLTYVSEKKLSESRALSYKTKCFFIFEKSSENIQFNKIVSRKNGASS